MGSAEDAVKEKLLWNVKKEVKSGQGPLGARVPACAAPGGQKAPRPPPGAGGGSRGPRAGSWTGCGPRPPLDLGTASSPRPGGLGPRSRDCVLRDPAAPRPATAAALGDRGRGRGGGDF